MLSPSKPPLLAVSQLIRALGRRMPTREFSPYYYVIKSQTCWRCSVHAVMRWTVNNFSKCQSKAITVNSGQKMSQKTISSINNTSPKKPSNAPLAEPPSHSSSSSRPPHLSRNLLSHPALSGTHRRESYRSYISASSRVARPHSDKPERDVEVVQ